MLTELCKSKIQTYVQQTPEKLFGCSCKQDCSTCWSWTGTQNFHSTVVPWVTSYKASSLFNKEFWSFQCVSFSCHGDWIHPASHPFTSLFSWPRKHLCCLCSCSAKLSEFINIQKKMQLVVQLRDKDAASLISETFLKQIQQPPGGFTETSCRWKWGISQTSLPNNFPFLS